MIRLDTRVGPCSLRAWGLVLNFMGNAIALYGVAGVIRDGSRWPLLIAGLVVTVACVLVLAIPDTENNENRRLHE
ncbi:MAG: hypothetical protein VYE68_01925 [Acidobacteriota bacterium]|nr:hypothetical protein [Acidobacteriota bacterium]